MAMAADVEQLDEIRRTITILIECHKRGGSEIHQTQICHNLAELIKDLTAIQSSQMQTNNDSNNHEVHPNFIRTNMEYNNAMSMRKGATIRDVLGSKAELTTLPLVPTLSSLMAHRIEGISLLPATQDEQANQEAMDDTLVAITLTPTAFCAAHVYAQLLGMPGAWGSGLNDMEALSCLAAVIRRWSVECRGREHGIAAYMGAKKKQGPQGRKRRADMMEFGDDEYFNDGGSFQSDFNAVSPRALVLSGLEAAQALVKIPIQIEFMSWSYESREVLLDAVVCCLATAAALTSRQRGGHKQEEDGKIQELSQTTVVVASDSLARCITIARAPSSDNKTEVNSCYHETAVLILRGLTSLLCSKGDTPNGEAGKQGAHSAALATLENLVKAVAQDFAESTTSRTTATPRHAREVTMTSQTPRTAKSSRKSLGNVVNEVPTPAALKGGATPNRRSSIGRTSQILHHRPRPILSAILGMLQKLATDSNSIERANVRERTVATLTRCMPHFPVLEREYLIRFFIQMCQSKLPVHRLVAVDIAGAVLAETWFWNDHSRTPFSAGSNVKGTPASLRVSLSPRSVVEKNAPSALLGALQGRMLDRVPAVRARTAACLVSFLRSLCRCDKWESASAASAALEDCVSACSTSLHDVLSNRALTDDKATVRKSSIDALAALLLFCEAQELDHLRLSVVDASLLERLSRDTSLITRKAAADGISLLTEKCFKSETAWRPIEEVFERAWLNAILPMMLDVETTCVSKAVELFTGLVIEPILDEKEHRRSQTAWRLLSYIGEISGKTVAAAREVEAIKVALAKLRASETSRGEITLQLMKVICRFASTTLDGEQEHLQAFGDHVECQRTGVWVLFDAFVDDPKVVATIAILVRKKQINVDFIATIWKLMLLMLSQQTTPPKSTNKLRGSLISCLRILSKLASCVGTDRAQRAAEQLAVTLQTFSAPTEVAGFAISSVIAITLSVYADEDATTARKKCKEWIVNLLQECEFCISTSLENAVHGELRVVDELLLARALFICGQLSIVGFCLDEDVITKSASQLTQASDIMVSGLHIPPSPTLINLVMTMLSKTLPTKSMVLTPNSVRALAYVTLGKFCLRDEGLAKQSLPIFAGQIQANLEDACPSVQSNALLIMGDLCVRYTNMVDRYLPLMASCLQFGLEDDANNIFEERSHRGAVVRKHAVVLLSSLLLQDYIKWRGLLFQRFLVAAADMDDEVANIASATLCGPLLTRHPKLFFNQFVESLFVLNRCTAHPIYKAAAATGDGGAGIAVGFDGINLTGEPGRTRRHQMYGMMLSKMTDEEKIGITSRVAKEVLGAAIEGEGDLGRVCRAPTLDSETDERYLGAREVMRDAFAILTPMLRIRHSAAADDTEETELENTSQRVAVAKNRLLSKISSKHLIEIILPKLCTLKTVMQASQSPLLKDLMSYLVEVFRAYKREVKEFLADDPVLLQEIEFDARKFKSSQSKNHD